MSAITYTKTGTKAQTQIKLNSAIFGVKEINHNLLHQSYTTYLANGRRNLAVAKTRGEVSGSNKKPWKQKGTGRARVGSKRTPVWRGGGIVFGPTGNENYSMKLNSKAKIIAIRQALSAANTAGNIKLIEEFSIKQPKTKEVAKLLEKIDVKGYTIVVTDNLTAEVTKAFNNLANAIIVQAQYLNLARILDADTIVFTKQSLESLNNWLLPANHQDGAK